jgi:maleylacetoacetate isomerase
MKLYVSYANNAVYRVRIALALKGLDYQPEEVILDEHTGKSNNPEYLALNPVGTVPTLVDGKRVYRQSFAILEYLEDVYPTPSLLPGSSRDRERVRALSHLIIGDIDPLTDMRVLAYLKNHLALGKTARAVWVRHWFEQGFSALERLIANNPATGRYCHGDLVTFADICLIPQMRTAELLGWHSNPYPALNEIYHHCMELPEFYSVLRCLPN